MFPRISPYTSLLFTPLLLVPQASAQPLFEKVPASESGIDFVHTWTVPERWQDINSYAAMSGVALGDYDGDGLLDVFIGAQTDGGQLYRNLGNFKFENVTESSGLAQLIKGRWTTGVSFVDVDNDGRLDLFRAGHKNENGLYLNQGEGKFSDFSRESGLNFNGATAMGAFADFDRDGDLDCYLLTNKLPAPDGLSADAKVINGKIILPDEALEYKNIVYTKSGDYKIIDSGQRDYLLENDGTGRFTDVTKEKGLFGYTAPGLSAVWWDSDNDMWPDLYVANDFYLYDQFWKNEKGERFKDKHGETFPHQPWFSMGSDFGDFNGDGLMDYITTDMSPSSHFRSKLTMGDMSTDGWFLEEADPPQMMRNAVYINGGNGRFMEMAHQMGVSSTDWTWAVRTADLDLDGNLDLFFSTGMTKDFENSDLNAELEELLADIPKSEHKLIRDTGYEFWKDKPAQKDANFAFRGDGQLNFEDVSEDWGLDEESVSSGVAIGDLDNDGDLDLLVLNFEEAPFVYKNVTSNKGVSVRLQGEKSNKSGVGASLTLEREDGSKDHRYVSLSRGFFSSSGAEEVFSTAGGVKSLNVIWPSGRQQKVKNFPQSGTITVNEADALPSSRSAEKSPTLFVQSKKFEPLRHKENLEFDEYQDQPLLPQAASRYGPGLALGDLNGDGQEDLVLAGAAGTKDLLLIPTGENLSTIPEAQTVLTQTEASETLGALMVDVDGDNDLDLYLASGGTEVSEGDASLRDRLFINDGKGRLTLASDEALPDLRISSGPVVAADYDKDGDLDLFVGGRTAPGAYPTAPRSVLLRNDSSQDGVRFTDVTEELAPALLEAGMVSGAIWSDVDRDGWIDLLLACEWGPVRLMKNLNGGDFEERTEAAGLAERTGWFTSLSSGDFDHDGDIDFVVGNYGRNTKYHPTPESPALIYYGDFDESGKGQIVEAKKKGDSLLPVRGKSCSQNAMPFIRKKFPTYKTFAQQKLSNIYEDKKLQEAERFSANSLDSGVLINDGTGEFVFQALPAIAQVAPVLGTAVVDFDGDRHLDIVLGQNFYHPQRETGRYDGGQGLILKGDGKGGFEPLWPSESGFSAPGDSRALTVTDLNGDLRPDILLTENNGPTRSWTNQSKGDFAGVVFKEIGDSVSSRLELTYEDGLETAIEPTIGSGYLSQTSLRHFVPLGGGGGKLQSLKVTWSDGTEQSFKLKPGQLNVLSK